MTDVLPPHDPLAEASVVWWAVVSGVYGRRLLATLRPEDFYSPRWRQAWERLQAGDVLDRDDAHDVLNFGTVGVNPPAQAERVQDGAQRRALVSAAQDIAAGAWSLARPYSVEDALRRMQAVPRARRGDISGGVVMLP